MAVNVMARTRTTTTTLAVVALALAITVSVDPVFGRVLAPGQRRPRPTGAAVDPNAGRHQRRLRHAAFHQLGKVRAKASSCVRDSGIQ